MAACKAAYGRFMSAPHLQITMTAQEYIEHELKKLAEPIRMEDTGTTPIEDAIFAKVMSKKFRKLKADETAVSITKEAIKIAVKENKPVAVNCIFGGNKLWRLEESPEIDWAELFNVIYMARWLKSIASVYKPGAWLEYYSEDVVLEAMNNLPKEETDQYSETFRTMLEWLKQYLPDSIFITYRRYAEDYEKYEDFLAELESAKDKVFKELGNKLPELNEHAKAATEMNVRLLPGQADDPLWREKAELIHKSIERTKTMERYLSDPQYIQSCPTYFEGCITTGSTKKSYAKFWVGVGAIEESDKGYNAVILTPKQLESAEFNWEKVGIEGLHGKNFNKIRVLEH